MNIQIKTILSEFNLQIAQGIELSNNKLALIPTPSLKVIRVKN